MAAARSSLRCLLLALALSAAVGSTFYPDASVCEECSFCQCNENCCNEDICCQNLRQWGLAWMVVALVAVVAFICVTCITVCYICCGRRGERVIIQTPDTDRTPLHAGKMTSYGTDRQYV
ncbi:uncharacterized protein LOC126191406 [Schistocerca cancellata]|uniref:uncharacterized protein LOC126191406 n=1 Tax=Schistocerca cancellata TaxID=274614 RepID=UPI002118D835|nr:uncharacterized protein LOC126191406 [Schistocerca cancellata]